MTWKTSACAKSAKVVVRSGCSNVIKSIRFIKSTLAQMYSSEFMILYANHTLTDSDINSQKGENSCNNNGNNMNNDNNVNKKDNKKDKNDD